MQALPLQKAVIRVVKKISVERVADVFHVDTDLVGTSCFQADHKKRGASLWLVGEKLIMGHCGFSVNRIRNALNGGTGKPAIETSIVPSG